MQDQFSTMAVEQLRKIQLRRARICKYTCFALFPNTKSIASITLLFPLPFGPTTAEKLWKNPLPRTQMVVLAGHKTPFGNSSKLELLPTRARQKIPVSPLQKPNKSHSERAQNPNLVKWADALLAGVRLEVPHHHLLDKQPRRAAPPRRLPTRRPRLPGHRAVPNFHLHRCSATNEGSRASFDQSPRKRNRRTSPNIRTRRRCIRGFGRICPNRVESLYPQRERDFEQTNHGKWRESGDFAEALLLNSGRRMILAGSGSEAQIQLGLHLGHFRRSRLYGPSPKT